MRQPIYFDLLTGLKLLENVVGAGQLQGVHRGLLGSVGDLAVVDDEDVAVGTALGVGPANGLGEFGIRVGEEELQELVDCFQAWLFFVSGVIQCHLPPHRWPCPRRS